MRTNIVIDDVIMEKAIALSDVKTKREMIERALQEYITSRSRKNLMDLQGKIKFAEGYDYKALREGR